MSETFYVLLGGVLILPIGMFLIDAYFNRKEMFVEKLQGKMKGTTDATKWRAFVPLYWT